MIVETGARARTGGQYGERARGTGSECGARARGAMGRRKIRKEKLRFSSPSHHSLRPRFPLVPALHFSRGRGEAECFTFYMGVVQIDNDVKNIDTYSNGGSFDSGPIVVKYCCFGNSVEILVRITIALHARCTCFVFLAALCKTTYKRAQAT